MRINRGQRGILSLVRFELICEEEQIEIVEDGIGFFEREYAVFEEIDGRGR